MIDGIYISFGKWRPVYVAGGVGQTPTFLFKIIFRQADDISGHEREIRSHIGH